MIIIEGNVLDVYQYPEEGSVGLGSVLRLTQYLYYYLHDCGYQDIVFFDSLNGITNPYEQESLERFAKMTYTSIDRQKIKVDSEARTAPQPWQRLLSCKTLSHPQ